MQHGLEEAPPPPVPVVWALDLSVLFTLHVENVLRSTQMTSHIHF